MNSATQKSASVWLRSPSRASSSPLRRWPAGSCTARARSFHPPPRDEATAGPERSGPARPGLARRGLARPGLERPGLERPGLARPGGAGRAARPERAPPSGPASVVAAIQRGGVTERQLVRATERQRTRRLLGLLCPKSIFKALATEVAQALTRGTWRSSATSRSLTQARPRPPSRPSAAHPAHPAHPARPEGHGGRRHAPAKKFLAGASSFSPRAVEPPSRRAGVSSGPEPAFPAWPGPPAAFLGVSWRGQAFRPAFLGVIGVSRRGPSLLGRRASIFGPVGLRDGSIPAKVQKPRPVSREREPLAGTVSH